jgi:hypothetical protein
MKFNKFNSKKFNSLILFLLNTNIVNYNMMTKRNDDSISLVLVILTLLTLIDLNAVSAVNFHEMGYLNKTDVKTTSVTQISVT